MRPVRAAFVGECTRLTEVLGTLDRADLDRPTACHPWTVAQLLAHVRTGAGRLAGMLAAPAVGMPAAPTAGMLPAPTAGMLPAPTVGVPSAPTAGVPAVALVDAAGYFGAAKFTPQVDAARIADARREAARVRDRESGTVAAQAGAGNVAPAGHRPGRALAGDFDRAWRASVTALDAVPPDRVVRTRHGDAMTVTEFLRTRVVEVAVHGLDLAAALRRPPWLTPDAARVVTDLLTGGRPVPPEVGGDDVARVRALTGRRELTPAARAALSRAGFPPLFFAP